MTHPSALTPSHHRRNSQRGIALLITLVILSLLAIFMTEFSFENKLETRGIKNYRASFEARNAVKSIFKAVLVGIEEQEEIKFFKEYLRELLKLGAIGDEISFLNPPQPISLPAGIIADFPDVSFYTPFIRPIDHLYNLNRIQTPPFRTVNPETKDDVRRANKFINILSKWNGVSKNQSSSNFGLQNIKLKIDDILPIYAAVFDWLDKDDKIYESSIYGLIGAENNSYVNINNNFIVKNGFLDKLSEIQIINRIRNNSFPMDQWEKRFTIFPVGQTYDVEADYSTIKPRINVNLATYEEIVEFLDQFDQNTAYFMNYSTDYFDNIAQDYFEKREEIAKELTSNPRSKLSSDDIKNKLSNITQYERSGDFFIADSHWYEIFLKTEIDDVQGEVRAVISVSRNILTGKASELFIHKFFLN
mgnify:CR=1 FL=1